MCRFLAYRGSPLFLEQLVSSPEHSLIRQSVRAEQAKAETNGDGFGIGWYGHHRHPGVYREVHPAWSDENLRSICAQVQSELFFAHVRAATGTSTSRSNCHPFAHGRWLFMHNGQVGGWKSVRRQVETLIDDKDYAYRLGTTDSEAIFLAAVTERLDQDPVGAVTRTLRRIVAIMANAGVTEPLRFAAALTNGEDIYAFRLASDHQPPTLYWRQAEQGLIVVSEPLDHLAERWSEVPKNSVFCATRGGRHQVVSFDPVAIN